MRIWSSAPRGLTGQNHKLEGFFLELTHVKGNTYVLEANQLIPLYKLDDKRCILLDCGLHSEREDIRATLKAHNLWLSGIIVSHAHGDHSVNCRYFQQKYNIPIAMPMGEAALCYSLLTLKTYYYMHSPNTVLTNHHEMILDVDIPIYRKDGPFYFQGATFQIVHTPGHSPDHIAIITPDDVCYTGDAVLSERPLKFPYAIALQPTLDSLEKLIALDSSFYIVSHRGVFDDLTPVAESYRNIILDVAEHLTSLITAPMTDSEVAHAVCEDFALLSARVNRATGALRTLYAYLDFLKDRGDITITAHRGMRYFQPAPKPDPSHEEDY